MTQDTSYELRPRREKEKGKKCEDNMMERMMSKNYIRRDADAAGA